MAIYRTLILAGVVALTANAAMAAGGGHGGGRGGEGDRGGVGRNSGPDGVSEERIRDQGLNIGPSFTQTRAPELRGSYPVNRLPQSHR